jgi:adenylate kinase family enzyme
MGIPVVDMAQILDNVAREAGSGEFDHPFYMKVADMVDAGDADAIVRDKIPLKLLRLTEAAQEGFVLLNYPCTRGEAELMEEFKGGMNAFVHVSLPDEILVDIEENKMKCTDCDKMWYKNDIVSAEHGVKIDAFNRKDCHCDFSNDQFVEGSDPANFEKELEEYKLQKDELLAFYNHYGLLVDYQLRTGYDDYEKIKRQIQYNIKH